MSKRYELFISYADADRAWVEGYLFDALEKANIAFHWEAAFDLGAPRLTEFERAIKESERTLLVISPAYLADHTSEFDNLLIQTYGLESQTWPVIPLILYEADLPPRLAMLTRLDATDPKQYETAIKRLCDTLRRPLPMAAVRLPCPYPGMLPFQEEDSTKFFGRTHDIENLLQQLRVHPFLAVIGPSGSGKSSLVFAGLVPKLRRTSLFGLGKWMIKSLRPGEAPLDELSGLLGSDISDPTRAVANLFESNPVTKHLLLVVDQFEEIFTTAQQDKLKFQETLLKIVRIQHCFVVITVRADFYPELMVSPMWSEIAAHRAEVLPLDDRGLREAIVRPAEDVGVFVETALVERLVADAAGEPGVLPFVQETLVLLWDKVERRYLPLHAYEALVLPRNAFGGTTDAPRTGLQIAMARYAENVFNSLPKPQQEIARHIFLRLIQIGEGRRSTRRQQPITKLRPARADTLFDQTLNFLTASRLLTKSGEERQGPPKVDIAHEALITGWPRLAKWVEDSHPALQLHRHLSESAEHWHRLNKDPSLLYRGAQLRELLQWQKQNDDALNELEREFLNASVAQARRARRIQLVLILVPVLMIIVTVTFFYGYRGYLRQNARLAGNPVNVPGLSIAFEAYEVTNDRYRLCVNARECQEPETGLGTFLEAAQGNLPVTGIQIEQAAQFCTWIGRRLPTLKEWQFAATQGHRVSWPWGNLEPNNVRAHLPMEYLSPLDGPFPVGPGKSTKEGATPEGIHDLIGNVWEFAIPDSSKGSSPPQPYLVGGSFKTSIFVSDPLGPPGPPPGFELTVYNPSSPPSVEVTFRNDDVGFRCVEDL